jgi:transposase
MPTQHPAYVAIDIAKESLQIQTDHAAWLVPHTATGHRQLLERLRPLGPVQVVCEASGGYEQSLLLFLHQQGVPVSLLNPARVRAFARSEGQRAKTDPLDAAILLRFAHEKHPVPTPPPAPSQAALAAWLDRRAQLSEQLAREKNRLQKSPALLHPGLRARIAFIEDQLAEVDGQLHRVVQADATLRERAAVLQSVTGIGAVTTWSLLAYLSEIAATDWHRNQLVALAGLAPWNRDSGKWKGKRSISGGRAKVRRCLYMAAQSAAQHNPVIREYVQRLIARGKPYKCAIVAAMRKLLIHLQSLLKHHQNALAS